MSMTRDEIVDLALRYCSPDEVLDFPLVNDLFCLLMRELPADRILQDEEGWNFAGYGLCSGYTCDEESKPRGKWIWMHFASLVAFPPVAQVLKLQPPHIIKGRFQSADRSHEIRILKVTGSTMTAPSANQHGETSATEKSNTERQPETGSDKIVAFRKKPSR